MTSSGHGRIAAHLTVFVAGFFAPACDTSSPADDAPKGGATNGAGGAPNTGGTAGAVAMAGKGGAGGSAGTATTAGAGGSNGTAGSGPTAGVAGMSTTGGGSGTQGQGGAAGASRGGTGGSAGELQAGNSASGGSGEAGAGAGSGGGTGGNPHTGVWRIMPIGDSITGTTCYPQMLSQKLKNAGRTNFEFMGTNLNNQACTADGITSAPNVMTEGHGGYILCCLTGDWNDNCGGKGTTAELSNWLGVSPPPDVVLIHFGTNDVWNSIPTNTITTAYTKLVTAIRAENPNAVVFVAQILPMHPDGCTDGQTSCVNNRVKDLNVAIPAWATSQSTAASPVHVVDVYGSVGNADEFMPSSSLTMDGVHLTALGGARVADAWMASLVGQGIPD